MKVKFKYGIRTYSGTVDEMTYGSYRDGVVCIGRKYVSQNLTAQNVSMGEKMKNLGTLYRAASSSYKQNLKAYAVQNGRQNVKKDQLVPTAYAIFTKMMFAWEKDSDGAVNLAGVTLEDIQSGNAAVESVATAVEAGYLAPVFGYETLNADI